MRARRIGLRGRSALACAAVAAGSLVATTAAYAVPVMTLDKNTGGTVLAGETSTVTLSADNNAPDPAVVADWGYNTSFRDVLPDGISYVAGSAPIEPTIITNEPSTGETTLIWENATDVSPGSSFSLTYQVAHDLETTPEAPDDPATFKVGESYPNSAGVFVNNDPRFVPDFDVDGTPIGPDPGSFTHSATDSASTDIAPFELRITEPNAEGEILRGIHDHQTTYTFEIENNPALQTANSTIYAAFPAGLEFLGCGTGDNTTDAPTNAGSAEEYTGSGVINPANAPSVTNCPTFDVVDTISGTSWDPDGAGPDPALPLPEGGVWTVIGFDVGTLPPGQIESFDVVAGIPIRENTLDWNGAAAGNGTAPPTTGAQAANLDNNSGPETTDEQGLTVRGLAVGEYSGPIGPGVSSPQSDPAALTRTAEDFSVHKSASTGTIEQGQITTWSLLLETAEYRRVEDIVVTDTLPDGLCPLGGDNFADDFGTGSNSECDTVGGEQPAVEGVDIPGEGYTDATENADGTWALTWDETTITELGNIGPSSSVTITFPSRTRSFYQEGFTDDTPVLSNDSWSNQVTVTGPDFPDDGTGTAVPADEVPGENDNDASSSGQQGPGPAIRKRVADPSSISSGEACTAATYGAGPESYRQGDRVCWELRVDFPANLDSDVTPLRDFLPPGHTYVPGSATETGSNTIVLTAGDPAVDGDALTWTPVGGSVDSGSEVFEVVFETTIDDPAVGEDYDITRNLFKYATINSASSTFPQRADTDVSLQRPRLDLVKGVREVNGGSAGPGSNVDGVDVLPDDVVEYGVTVDNTAGDRDAINTEVWDILPVEFTLAPTAGTITNGGSYVLDLDGATADGNGDGDPTNDHGIQWTGLTIPAGDTLPLTYELEMPSAPVPSGERLDNFAGVRQYEDTNNNPSSGNTIYIPSNNIDPSQERSASVDPADDPSHVFIAPAGLDKTRTTEVVEAGNTNPQATIGEEITYTVTATAPANTTAYQPQIVDDYAESRLVITSVQLLPGGANDGGWTVNDTGDEIFVTRTPSPVGGWDRLVNSTNTDQQLTLRYTAMVRDIALNEHGDLFRNTARLTWNIADGSNPAEPQTARTRTDIVEPNIDISKGVSPSGGRFIGETLLYAITVSNPAGRSTAHNVTVTDAIPAGLTYVPGSATLFQFGGSAGTITDPAAGPDATGITLEPGQSANISYQVTITGGVDETLTNIATVTADSLTTGGRTEASAPANNDNADFYEETTGTAVTVVELELDKQQTTGVDEVGNDEENQASIGEEVEYVLETEIPEDTTIFPTPSAAFIADTLPSTLSVVDVEAEFTDGAIGTIGPISAGGSATVGDWTLSSSGPGNRTIELALAPGASYASGVSEVEVALTINAVVADRSPNIDGVNFDNAGDLAFDTAAPGDSPQSLTDSSSTSGTVVEPDVEVTKSNDSSGEVGPGATITYTVTHTNIGSSTGHSVTLTDPLPSGLSFGSIVSSEVDGAPTGAPTHDGSPTGGDLTWVLPTLEPGQTAELVYTADVASGVGAGSTVDNTATVTTESIDAGDDPTGNRRTNASSPAGDNPNPARYEEQASSSFTVVGAGVTKTLTSAIGAAGNDIGRDLTIGERVTYTLRATIAAGTTIRPHGSETHVLADRLPPNLTPVSARATISVPGFPDIGPITPGGSATEGPWTLTQDTGPNPLVGLALPAGGGFTAPAGQDVELTITVEAILTDVAANAAGSPFDNEVTLAWSDGGGNQTARDTASARIVEPDISIEKTNTAAGAVSPGDAVTFIATVRNGTGADVSVAEALQVSDILPAGITLVDGSLSGVAPGGAPAPTYDASSRRISWDGLRLMPGETARLTYQATVDGTVSGPVTNIAAATANTVADGTGRSYSVQSGSSINALPPGQVVAQAPPPPQSTLACETGGAVSVSRRALRVGVQTSVLAVVRDANGTPVVGHEVQLVKEKGKATLRSRRTVTDANGHARFSVRANNQAARLRIRGAECGDSPRIVARKTATCRGVRSTHRQIDVGRQTRVRILLRSGRQPIRNTRVIARGAGVRKAARTNAKGVAILRISPEKAGAIRVQAPNALRCSVRIGAAQRQAVGDALTG